MPSARLRTILCGSVTSIPRSRPDIHESGAKKEGLIKYDLSNPGDWSEVILKGIQIGLANPMFKSPDANSNDAFGLDLVPMPIDETPEDGIS